MGFLGLGDLEGAEHLGFFVEEGFFALLVDHFVRALVFLLLFGVGWFVTILVISTMICCRRFINPYSAYHRLIPILLFNFLLTFLKFALILNYFLNFSGRIPFQNRPIPLCQMINIQIIQLPSNIMNASKNIQFIHIVIHRMTISY